MKRLAVLGSTGTIGLNTLELVRRFPDQFTVSTLAAGSNGEALCKQIEEFQPKRVAMADRAAADLVRTRFPRLDVFDGEPGVVSCAAGDDVDIVVVGIVGFAGLRPTLAAARDGKHLALANKEVLVVAGALLREEIEKGGGTCVPVDSEHSALFQLLEKVDRNQVASLVLTASGGPLLRRPELPLSDVTPELAVKHPNWKMGPKISVDSATMMNKGLELVEAAVFFDVPETQIEVWVHPQSIVHGALWLEDNSCIAHLSVPDMKSSIGYALSYPNRLPAPVEKLSFSQFAKLEFLEPDTERFRCLSLARNALRSGGRGLVALNAANEVAVEAFLDGRIGFDQIPVVVERTLETAPSGAVDCLDEVFELDRTSRANAMGHVEN